MSQTTHVCSLNKTFDMKICQLFNFPELFTEVGGGANTRVRQSVVKTDLFLAVGVDKDVISTPSSQRFVADYTINGTNARYILLTANAILQQTATSATPTPHKLIRQLLVFCDVAICLFQIFSISDPWGACSIFFTFKFQCHVYITHVLLHQGKRERSFFCCDYFCRCM